MEEGLNFKAFEERENIGELQKFEKDFGKLPIIKNKETKKKEVKQTEQEKMLSELGIDIL